MLKKSKELKAIERVSLAIQGQETDRVPVCTLTVGCGRLTTGISFPDFSTKAELAAEAIIATNQLIEDDVIFSFIDLSVEAADFGQEIIYPHNTTAHPNYNNPLIKDVDDYERLELFDPTKSPRMSNYLKMTKILVDRLKNDYPILSFVYGPLGILGMLRGTENLFLDIFGHPEKVKYALDVITEVLVKYVSAQCDLGVTGVCVDTLPAALSGVSRPVWEEFEGRYIEKIAVIIRDSGCLVANHGCGQSPYFREVMKWLNPAVVSFAEFPLECPDAVSLKKTYGKDITLMGYVSTDLLYSGTPKEVMEECWNQIDQLGKGGRYILAPGCEYPPNNNIVNARAMVVAAKLYSKIIKEKGNVY